MELPEFTFSEIEKIAADVLRPFYPLDRGTIPIEELFGEKLGTNVELVVGLTESFGVEAFLKMDLTTIAIDKSLFDARPHNRYRYLMCRQLAHRVVHPAFYRGSFDFQSDPRRLRESIDALPPDVKERFDWQADTFAGLFLVQPAALLRLMNNTRRDYSKSGKDPDAEIRANLDRIVLHFTQQLGASAEIVIRRMKEDGIWPIDE